MNMRKVLIITIIMLSLLALSAGSTLAQGGPNGNGPDGRGNGAQSQNGAGFRYGNRNQSGQNGSWTQGNPAGNTSGFSTLPAASTTPLTSTAIDAMTSGLLDEYHAWATYEDLMAQIGEVRPLVSIQQAEAQHITAWEFLFERYGLTLPESVEPVAAPQVSSRSEACALAAELEKANFGLYDAMAVAVQDYPDVAQVVQSLRDASEFNHLPALERCAGL